MTYQHVQGFASLQSDLGQPLIGVITEEQEQEVVRYFTEEQEADQENKLRPGRREVSEDTRGVPRGGKPKC